MISKNILMLISYDPDYNRLAYYWCDCGNICKKDRYCVEDNRTKSCGCLQIKHGMFYTSEYNIWAGLKKRCLRESNKDFYRYGGRGISVSQEWIDKFENFYRDMGPRPSKKHSIERRDNNGDYCNENCYWATRPEQYRNKSNNIKITWNGKEQTLAEWSRELGIKYGTLHKRIFQDKLSIEEAFTKKIRGYNEVCKS